MKPAIQFTDRWLRLTREDGHESLFPALWLLDNCPRNRDEKTGQRLVDITDLPPQPRISGAEIHLASVQIHRKDESQTSGFAIQWLFEHCLCDEHSRRRRPNVTTWTREEAANLCWMDHSAVSGDKAARLEWLRAIACDGLAFLRGVILGYITETNFGRLFEVRAVSDPNNLAYTPAGLGVHTDNPYRDPVPGYQILHCIEPSPDGGDSMFVDGFRVAEELEEVDPGAFALLARIPVRFAFRDRYADLEAERPMLQLDHSGALKAVHYNNRSLSSLRMPADKLPGFHRAYRSLASLLRDARFDLRLKLGAGDLVVFDNHRILHGRAAFTGPRHLQGCYINRDGLASNLAVLERIATS